MVGHSGEVGEISVKDSFQHSKRYLNMILNNTTWEFFHFLNFIGSTVPVMSQNVAGQP